jgi:hypothetical protein
MAERRPLTPDERKAAAALAQAMATHGWTAEALALDLGLTPGAVGHWARGELVVPLDRVGAVAAKVGVDPATISVRWRQSVTPYLNGSAIASPQSQAARLDPEKIVITTRATNKVLDRRVKGLTLDLTQSLDADMFAEAYAECEAMPEPNEADMVLVVVDLMAARGEKRGKEGKQVGGTDRGEDRKARTG